MSQWTKAELDAIAGSDDLHISPYRNDGATYGTPTWIWSVVAGDSLYVRAYNGRKSRWYQAAVQQKAGRIKAAGMERDVTFRPADRKQQAAIDAAYRAKYSDSPYLRPMIGDGAKSATVEVSPRRWSALSSRRRPRLKMKPAVLAITILLAGALPMRSPIVSAETAPHRVVRIAELAIDPAQIEAYKVALREEIATSIRFEQGVLTLYAVSVKDQPDHVRLFEIYADTAAYEAHLRSAHFLKYKKDTASMVRSLNLLETEPILLATK